MLDLKKIGNYLSNEIEGLYFQGIFTFTYGDTYIEGIKGKTLKFIMWREVIIWENGVLEVPSGSRNEFEKDVIKQIFKLLDTELICALSTNEFDKVKDCYSIIENPRRA